jgi:hypothetical protein
MTSDSEDKESEESNEETPNRIDIISKNIKRSCKQIKRKLLP